MNEQRQADPDPAGEGDGLSRIGDCLHASFPADNHDSFDGDTTRLLLHLSRDPAPEWGQSLSARRCVMGTVTFGCQVRSLNRGG